MTTSPLHDALRTIIDDGLRDELSNLIDGQELSEAGVVEVLTDVDSRLAAVRQVLDALSDPFDQHELYNCVAMLWLEQRFAWTRLNQVLQYAMVRTGSVEPVTFAQAGCVAGIVGALERVLAEADRDRLLLYASQPLEMAVQTPEQQREVLEYSRRRGDVARDLRTSIQQQADLVREWANEGVENAAVTALGTGLDGIARETEALEAFALASVWSPLCSAVAAGAPFEAPVYRLQLAAGAGDLQLDQRTFDALQHTLSTALNALLTCTTYGTNAPGCVTVCCDVDRDGEAVRLQLTSDGCTRWTTTPDGANLNEEGALCIRISSTPEVAA